MRLAIVTIVADLLSLVCAALVFLNGRILNPAFVSNVGALFTVENAEWLPWFFARGHLFFLGLLCFALLLDMVTTLVKAVKYDTIKKQER